MYMKLTERERLAMEDKLLREMAARYARLIEKKKAETAVMQKGGTPISK